MSETKTAISLGVDEEQLLFIWDSLTQPERKLFLRDSPDAMVPIAAREYSTSPVTWLLGSKMFPQQVRTRDEHDQNVAAKPFPDKPYIREMVRLWEGNRMYLWDAQFGMNRLNFIQSKKEEDSDALLQRCFFIWEQQDDWLKEMFPAVYTYCHIEFAYTDRKSELARSRLWGIAQGPDVLRQHTGSGLFVDEAAFQIDLEKK